MRRSIRFLPYEPTPFWKGQAIALVGVAVATVARSSIDPLIDDGLYFTFLFPAVVLTALWGGVWAGCTTAVAGALLVAYIWIPPAGLRLTNDELVRVGTFWFAASLIIAVCGLTRVILQELHEARSRAEILSHEMEHRVRNSLTVVSMIARQTMGSAKSAQEGEQLFQARLVALSRAQELLGDKVDGAVDLRSLLDRVLAPFEATHFTMKGADVLVPSDVAVTLALLVHELATNAVKHGALSVDSGMVLINWSSDDAECRLEWEERGGPAVEEPVRKGFGTRLLQAAFPRDRGASSVAYLPDGVRCSATFTIGAIERHA